MASLEEGVSGATTPEAPNASTEAKTGAEKPPVPFDTILVDIKAAGKFPKSKQGELKRLLNRAYLYLKDEVAPDTDPREVKKNLNYWRGRIADEALSGIPKEKKDELLRALDPYLRRTQISDEDLLKQYDVPLPKPVIEQRPTEIASGASPSGDRLIEPRYAPPSAPPVATGRELSDNRRDMPNESLPTSQNPAEATPPVTPAAKTAEKATQAPAAPPNLNQASRRAQRLPIPDDVRAQINKVLAETDLEAQEIEKGAQSMTGLHSTARRSLFEGAHRRAGERVHDVLASWQRRTRQDVLGGIPDEYMRRLPGDKYVRGKENVATTVVGAVREDLGVPGKKGGTEAASSRASGGEGSDASEPVAELELETDGKGVSEKLKKARKRRKERTEQTAEAEVSAPDQPLTPEDAMDNPDFQKFLLAYFPDGNIPDKGPEVLAAQVEMFNKHQETVRTVADFYAELMEADGIVKVDKATREEFRTSIDAFLLKNVRNAPTLAQELMTGIKNYREAPARIAEKEKTLAELGSRETLVAQRDALLHGRQAREKIQADYGKGPLRSFFNGFRAGFRQKTTPEKGFRISAVGEQGELQAEPTTERKLSWRERFARGWKGAGEAKEKSQLAMGEMSSESFRVIDEALNSGALEDLESKIKTLDDAERQKKTATEAFDRARKVIFDGVGELSGVVGKMREKTMSTLQKMTSGEGDLASFQESFDRLAKARERLASDDVSYLDSGSVEQTMEDVEALIEMEFENSVQEVLAKDLSKEKPYSALRKMLGKFARLENLGSKHSGEVREFFAATVADYLKKNKDVSPQKRLILNRLVASFNESEEEKSKPETSTSSQEAPERASAPEASDQHPEEAPKIPKKGDHIRVTFPVKIQGMPQEVTDGNAEVLRFKFKGETPRPNAEMTVLASYFEKPGDKKKKTIEVQMTYGHYLKFNGGQNKEEHA